MQLHSSRHIVRLQPQRRFPKRRLGEHALSRPTQALGSVFLQQSRPAEWPEYLNVETAHHVVETIAGIGFSVQHLSQVSARRPVLSLDVEHVQKHVPVAQDRLVVEAREAAVIDLEQVKRRDDAEDATGVTDQLLARLGQLELALGVPSDLQRDQNVVQIHQRAKVDFVQHLVDGEEVFLGIAGPVELARRPMHEHPLECLRRRHPYSTMLGDVGEGLSQRPHHWRMRQRGGSIVYLVEFDQIIPLADFSGTILLTSHHEHRTVV